MENLEKFEMGAVVKPKGLDGTIKCTYECSDFASLKKVTKLFVGGVEHNVVRSYGANGFAFFKLDDVNSIEEAESLRGQKIEILRSEAEELGEGESYVADMIGAKVVDDLGKEIGVLVDIANYGASDILVLNSAGGELLVPIIPNLIVEFDGKVITLNNEILKGLI